MRRVHIPARSVGEPFLREKSIVSREYAAVFVHCQRDALFVAHIVVLHFLLEVYHVRRQVIRPDAVFLPFQRTVHLVTVRRPVCVIKV